MNKFKCAVEVICPNINKPSKACLHCPSPSASGKVRTKDTCATKRPLTDDEVDELERFEYHLWMLKHGKVVGAKWDSFYWNKVDSGEMYFKGSQVVLIPKEAADETG